MKYKLYTICYIVSYICIQQQKKIILPNGIKHTHIRLPIAMVAIA